MRRIVMFNRVSADGYFAAPDGNLDWVVPDEKLDKEGAAASSETGTILFGRRTYQMFESFWPSVVDESPTAPNPHAAGQRSPEMRQMGVFINEAEKLVFSRTLKKPSWKNSRILGDFDPRKVEELKRQPGKDMIIFGSGSIVSLLTEHGLIDDYHFVVNPVLLGKGRSLVAGVSKRWKLDLQESRSYPSGNILLRYSRAS